MKNITVSVDDATYRSARVAAAKRDTSVSALVRRFLQNLAASEQAEPSQTSDLETLMAEITARHPGFSCSDNLPREALHERR